MIGSIQIDPCCLGAGSAVPPALERPLSIFSELLSCLSHTETFTALLSSSWATWSRMKGVVFTGAFERWRRGRDVGAARNVEQFQRSPFKWS